MEDADEDMWLPVRLAMHPGCINSYGCMRSWTANALAVAFCEKGHINLCPFAALGGCGRVCLSLLEKYKITFASMPRTRA